MYNAPVVKKYVLSKYVQQNVDFILPAYFEKITRIEIISNYLVEGSVEKFIGEAFLEFSKKQKFYQVIQQTEGLYLENGGIFLLRLLTSVESPNYEMCEPIQLGCNRNVRGLIKNATISTLNFKLYLYP